MGFGEIVFLWEVATNHQDHAWIEDDVRAVLEDLKGSWTVTVLPASGGWWITARESNGTRSVEVAAPGGRAGELERLLRKELNGTS